MRSDSSGETLLPKKPLPVFASDALSSVAYAPDEIFPTLGLGGRALALTASWQIALAAVVLRSSSWRPTGRSTPTPPGGGLRGRDHQPRPRAGLTVASALLVDYVLTVAVSISSGVQNAAAALPFVRATRCWSPSRFVAILTAMNLRGCASPVPPSRSHLPLHGQRPRDGGCRVLPRGQRNPAAGGECGFELIADPEHAAMSTLAMGFLMLRAFSGCAALTGVEAISNGVPAFQKPKSRNAATTLLLWD